MASDFKLLRDFRDFGSQVNQYSELDWRVLLSFSVVLPNPSSAILFYPLLAYSIDKLLRRFLSAATTSVVFSVPTLSLMRLPVSVTQAIIARVYVAQSMYDPQISKWSWRWFYRHYATNAPADWKRHIVRYPPLSGKSCQTKKVISMTFLLIPLNKLDSLHKMKICNSIPIRYSNSLDWRKHCTRLLSPCLIILDICYECSTGNFVVIVGEISKVPESFPPCWSFTVKLNSHLLTHKLTR